MARVWRILRLTSFCLSILLSATAQNNHEITGRVLDATGAVIPHAGVTLSSSSGTQQVKAGADGSFRMSNVEAGKYKIAAHANGFAESSMEIVVQTAAMDVVFKLRPGTFVEEVSVQGTHLFGADEAAQRVAGSVDVVSEKTLEESRVRDFGEALRKVAGVNVREEEGLGLRPNIAFRGLNPTRSSKLLLLEDGVPFTYSVYGDNASYYHPPVERFNAIEVLKGSGQILYGPTTVGGVVNYITPEPPKNFAGSIIFTGGNRNYLNGSVNVGGTFKKTGILLDAMRKQGEGARANMRSGLNDVTLKLTRLIGTRQTVSLKGNFYGEDSNMPYSGLRLAEYRADARQNPFRNDFFYGRRHGATLNHTLAINGSTMLFTNVYGAVFTRDWWRQSSNSGQRPNDSADAACGGMANLNTTCGNEGRQRQYHTAGIDPHLRYLYKIGMVRSELDIGFRAHFEKQYRIQRNGATPTARSGSAVENNVRHTEAYSTFVQNRFMVGKFTFTPGVRIEQINHSRFNGLTNARGENSVLQAVPGFGAAYAFNGKWTAFAGVHRGFAPPRVEDVIGNNGGTVDLAAELSWNYEAGVRAQPYKGVRFDATYFRMDYENQIVPASLAGGVGASLTNGGSTLHQGFEVSGRVDTGVVRGSRHNVFLSGAFTNLPRAEFTGMRFSNIAGNSGVSVTGNRLPYAPRQTMTGGFGYENPSGLHLQLEAVFIGEQFGDDLNTVASTADGQRGLLPSQITWNATANYKVEEWKSTFFVAVKNLTDATNLVDRSRGMIPGNSRLMQAGIKFHW